MKNFRMSLLVVLSAAFILAGCSSWNKTQKGAVAGTAAGGAAGAVIGRASGNTALGAIIGAAVGGASGAVIGRQMDKQAEEIKKTVPDAKVERVGEGIVVEFNSSVLFGFDKSGLTGDAKMNLDKLVTVLDTFSDEERKYILHPWTHVDFLFFNRLSKEKLFVLEVDGIRYHEQDKKQAEHDNIKNRVFQSHNLPIYRFKTNESNEKQRITEIIKGFSY